MNKYWVIDTNILVSALLNANESKALVKARDSGILLVSTALKEEYFRVLCRRKFDKYISLETRLELFAIICEEALEIDINEKIAICRDQKDNMLLEIGVEAKVNAILTGDKDLLVLHPFRNIPILSSADFIVSF